RDLPGRARPGRYGHRGARHRGGPAGVAADPARRRRGRGDARDQGGARPARHPESGAGPVSPVRRDGEGRPHFAHSWESLIERQIKGAMAAREFDELPFRGEPIPIDDDGTELALAPHVLRQAGFAPGWIATDADIRGLLARRDAILARARRAGPPARERDCREISTIVG